MKITEEIFQVGGSGLTSDQDAAVYLLYFNNEAALIDAGCGWDHDKLILNTKGYGIGTDLIKHLLITHCHFDHTGGIQSIKETTGCKVIAHEKDAVFLENADQEVTAAAWYGADLEPVTIDLKLKGNHNNILLGGRNIEAIHIPGHSPGSLAYLTESQGLKILFGQDVHGPLDESLLSNRKDYINSLKVLLSLEADILCEGHFGVYKGKKEVERFIRSFL